MDNLILQERVSNVIVEKDSIIFISDLHFDFTKRKYMPELAGNMEDDFILFIENHYSENILCLAGDFYNDYKKTLSFIKRLENVKVNGFFVLGNHDYWNNGNFSHVEIIDIFSDATKDHQHFKFLTAGRKYYHQDVCIIGDTGWTSFKRGERRVPLHQFMGLPEKREVKNFDPKEIISLHDTWVLFANNVLAEEDKVLIITHFPMIDLTEKDKDCWWSSTTALAKNNGWQIFGHTHQSNYQSFNNVSSQRGYYNYDNDSLKNISSIKTNNKGELSLLDLGNENSNEHVYTHEEYILLMANSQYKDSEFGKLEKTMVINKGDIKSNFGAVSRFYSPVVVVNQKTEKSLVLDVRKRGYKRCAANKNNFHALIKKPKKYIEDVNRIINGYIPKEYIGYTLSGGLSTSIIESIFSSIAIIESGIEGGIREFITAAIITGYVYNHLPYLINRMRPLDDYDIMRFWLMFLALKKSKKKIDSIGSIVGQNKNKIFFNNVEIKLPSIDDFSLEIDTVKASIQETNFLPFVSFDHR